MRHPVCERILNEWLNATWAATKCTCLHGTFKSFAIREVEEPLSTDTLSTRNYNRSIGKLTRLGRNHTLYFLIPDSLNSLLLSFFLFFSFVSSHLSLSSSVIISIHAPLFVYWVQRIGSVKKLCSL